MEVAENSYTGSMVVYMQKQQQQKKKKMGTRKDRCRDKQMVET